MAISQSTTESSPTPVSDSKRTPRPSIAFSHKWWVGRRTDQPFIVPGGSSMNKGESDLNCNKTTTIASATGYSNTERQKKVVPPQRNTKHSTRAATVFSLCIPTLSLYSGTIFVFLHTPALTITKISLHFWTYYLFLHAVVDNINYSYSLSAKTKTSHCNFEQSKTKRI